MIRGKQNGGGQAALDPQQAEALTSSGAIIEEVEYRASLNNGVARGDASLLRRAESFDARRARERHDEYIRNDLHMLSREVEALGRKHRRPSGRHSRPRLDARLPEDEQYDVFLNFADRSLGDEYARSCKRALIKVAFDDALGGPDMTPCPAPTYLDRGSV